MGSHVYAAGANHLKKSSPWRKSSPCLKFKANDHGYDNFRSSNKYSSSWKKEYSFSLFWTEIIQTKRCLPKWNKTLCVFTKQCTNLRVIIFFTLKSFPDIWRAISSMKTSSVELRKPLVALNSLQLALHYILALQNFWSIHTTYTFNLSSLRIPVKDVYFCKLRCIWCKGKKCHCKTNF